MIFSENSVAALCVGFKVVTRRPVGNTVPGKYDAHGPLYADTPVAAVYEYNDLDWYRDGRVRWRIGQLLAVQPGRGRPALAHVQVVSLAYDARVCDLDAAEAMREGYENVGQFRAAWIEMHGVDGWCGPAWRLGVQWCGFVREGR